MRVVLGVVLMSVGGLMFGFGPRIARARISLHFSYEELRATSGPRHRRVRRATLVATVLTMAVGAAFVAMGVRGLLG